MWDLASTPSKFNIVVGIVSIMFGVFCGVIVCGAAISRLTHYEFGTMDAIFCGIPLTFIWIGLYLIKKELQSNKVGDTTLCHCSPH
jgi:hypothetical protein